MPTYFVNTVCKNLEEFFIVKHFIIYFTQYTKHIKNFFRLLNIFDIQFNDFLKQLNIFD